MNTVKIRKKTITSFGILITLMIGLSGCASGPKYAKHKVDPQAFQSGNKAIVVMKLYAKGKGLFGKDRFFPTQFSLAKVDSNYENLDLRHRYRTLQAFLAKYSVMMIEPGDYTIEEIVYNDNRAQYYTTADGYCPEDNKFIFGRFTVKPNEVVYIGDLTILDTSKKKPMTLCNSYDKAVEYFVKKHPELSNNPVIKRDFVLNSNPYPVSLFSEKIIQTVYIPI